MGAPHVVWMLALLLENAAQQPSPTPSDDLELVWRAPPQCPSTDTVHGMILDKLAEHPGDTRPVSASALVDATVTAGDQTYHLDLRVRTQGSLMQREIAARDCALLARTTGLVVGLALDSTVSIETVAKTMEQQPDADDDPMAPVPPAPTGDPVADVVGVPIIETPPSDALVSRERSSASRAPLAVALRLSGGADVGILPRVGGGLGSSVAVAGPRWRAEIHASRWFSRAQTFPGEASVGANFAMWSGGARGCLVLGERVEIPICGGAEIGQIQAAGFGARVDLRVRSLWAGAVIAPGVVWLPLPWLGVFGGLEGFAVLRRPAFGGENRPLLHRSAPVAVRALAGIEVRFGSTRSGQKK